MADFGVLSLLPPLVAIILAIWTKRVLLALFAGVWIGGVMVSGWNPITGTTQTLDWIVGNAIDDWNAKILLFDFLIGAGVGLIYKSGGAMAIAKALTKTVRTSRAASLMGWLLGILVFFDDYTNTIIVGNTMRPITDKTRVSREMLAYIDDSTAAPVAGLALVSTWIGYEVGLIGDSFKDLGITLGPYAAWLSSVPYRFYSIFAIILVFLVAYTQRHYGAMLHAEYRARTTGKVLRDGAKPLMTTEIDLGAPKEGGNVHTFIWPILTLVFVTLYGMWVTGGGSETFASDGLMGVLSNSDPALALLWGSFAMVVVAFFLVVGMKIMTVEEAETAIVQGMKQMIIANTILLLAWSIKSATDAVGTANYVVGIASGVLSPGIVPLVIFLIAMFISFTTGTSWGTFSIMMPIAIPLAYHISGEAGPVLWASIGAVFAGGIFGDHCSPISDTTIMSSMFSGSDHIDHVTTQIPYAATAASVGIILYILFAIGIRTWIVLLPIGLVLLVAAHWFLSEWYGKKYGIPHGKVPVYVVEE
ncbi:Na+/H+ antiporter NhaC family protein [Thermococcus sp. M39]|uniref:Na+/H+ antiporter NhaC family protein n=1 Tax=unclassified Thermococcus TaxID=2627626 RepID=UPI00143A6994|nr:MULTISPECIES: Na+/H+ antiporter NhaC family protein [unclassified Thermococcus]NJE09221.1 Na+/H+ antiporter NhaC family protein [Thermococcus sp. M39]NJE11975.1 Na+/H+ antiporter NhaC family protein [Thermococcus sp. LS2]